MMASLGYNVTDEYVAGVLDTFGAFDTNGDGRISLGEFPGLWAHLGSDTTSAAATGADAADPLYATFKKYDSNGSNDLSQYEIGLMMKDLGFKVDRSYMAGLMEMFGDFDKNDDGVVQFSEFQNLWDHLGAGADGEEASEADASDPLFSIFTEHDLNGKGYLSQYEVKQMLVSLDYKVTKDYMGGLMELFGDFDMDQDGIVQFAEFKLLWNHLSGGGDAAAAAPSSVNKLFGEFDPGSGVLGLAEIKAAIISLGFKAPDEYVAEVMQIFGQKDAAGAPIMGLADFEALHDYLVPK